MSNLFSTFDPVSWFYLPLNWISSILVLISLPGLYWMAPNPGSILISSILNTVSAEFKASLNPNSVPGMLLLSLSFLIFVATNNFMGLIPYVFTASSHMALTLALALPLWLGHMLLGIGVTPKLMLAHLVPLGTPSALIPFMVIVEIVSSVIRPMTLAIRLAANMIAGHLLMSLMGGQGPTTGLSLIWLVLFGLILLAVLECAVSLIQAYVFSVLSTLYINEVNSPQISYL